MVKIFIAHVLSPPCYYIGDYASKILRYRDCYFLAEIYEKFMAWSWQLEEWCDKEIIWTKIK
jgi:hypothetical protein